MIIARIHDHASQPWFVYEHISAMLQINVPMDCRRCMGRELFDDLLDDPISRYSSKQKISGEGPPKNFLDQKFFDAYGCR